LKPFNKNKVWQAMTKAAETISSSAAVVALCREHGLSALEAPSLTVSFSFVASDFFVPCGPSDLYSSEPCGSASTEAVCYR
jgi:hypothetical protein